MKNITRKMGVMLLALLFLSATAMAGHYARKASGRVQKGMHTFSRKVPRSNFSSLKRTRPTSVRTSSFKVDKSRQSHINILPRAKKPSSSRRVERVKPREYSRQRNRRDYGRRDGPRDNDYGNRRPRRQHQHRRWYDYLNFNWCSYGDNYSICVGSGLDYYPSWDYYAGWSWDIGYWTDDWGFQYTATCPTTYCYRVWVPGHWETVCERVSYIGRYSRVRYRTVHRRVWIPGYWKTDCR